MRGKNRAKSGSAVSSYTYGICTRSEKYKAASNHKKRYLLQSTARWILSDNKRLYICNRATSPEVEWVKVKYSPSTKKAKYSGLMQCGNGWICPVCAGRIADTRKKELHVAVVAAMQKGLKPVMVTYTMRHGQDDTLLALVVDLLKAYRAMVSHRPYKKIKDAYGVAGYVRSLEMTHGNHGWHPHLHVMMLLPVEQFEAKDLAFDLEQDLFQVWDGELSKVLRDGEKGIAVHVRTGDSYVADYIAKYDRMPKKSKWSIEAEMTMHTAKRSKDDWGGRTPFAILLDAYIARNQEDINLYREYEAATWGRSTLQYSRGLAEFLGIDIADEVAALDMSAGDFEDTLLFNLEMWKGILKAGKRADVLDMVIEHQGDTKAAEIVAFLDALKERIKQDDIDPEEQYEG